MKRQDRRYTHPPAPQKHDSEVKSSLALSCFLNIPFDGQKAIGNRDGALAATSWEVGCQILLRVGFTDSHPVESSTTINDPRHSRTECDMRGEKKRPIQMDTLLYRRWILHFNLHVGVSTYGGFNMMSNGQIVSCCTYRGISKMHEAQFGSNTDSYKLTPPVTRMKKSDTMKTAGCFQLT